MVINVLERCSEAPGVEVITEATGASNMAANDIKAIYVCVVLNFFRSLFCAFTGWGEKYQKRKCVLSFMSESWTIKKVEIVRKPVNNLHTEFVHDPSSASAFVTVISFLGTGCDRM